MYADNSFQKIARSNLKQQLSIKFSFKYIGSLLKINLRLIYNSTIYASIKNVNRHAWNLTVFCTVTRGPTHDYSPSTRGNLGTASLVTPKRIRRQQVYSPGHVLYKPADKTGQGKQTAIVIVISSLEYCCVDKVISDDLYLQL